MTDTAATPVCNIAAYLPAVAGERPDVPAIVVPSGRENGRVRYTQYTFRELDEDSDRIARGLERLELGRGVRIALMVTPSLDFFALMFALFKVGAVPVLIDPGIGLKPLKECLAEAQPEAFIGVPRAQIARLLFGWGRHSIHTVITVGRRWFWGGYTLNQVRALGATGDPVLAPTGEEDVAAILFTSGSTGIPKGAVYRHGNFVAQVEMIRETYGIEPGEIDLPTFPPFSLFDPALGMTTIIPDMDASRPATVDAAKLVEAMERFGVTNMFGSPAVLARLVAYGRPLPATLRRVLSAGAPVRPVILDGMRKILPEGVQVFTPYGATESLPVSSIGSAEILGDTRTLTDQGYGICVGHPVSGVDVSIIEISDDAIPIWEETRPMAVGQIGEIVVRSASVTTEYFNRVRATLLAKIRGPKWDVAHRMGDVGYFDPHGRLWYCGRKSHRVITPRGTLFTEQVEGIFNAELGGVRTALVGVSQNGVVAPIVCVEVDGVKLRIEPEKVLKEIAQKHPAVADVQGLLLHPGRFPVDIRHNSKIFREKLAVWASGRLR